MAVATKLTNSRFRWFTDNQNVARILLVGSKKPLLHALAVKVFSLSVQNHIRLEPEWTPRDLNERADALSRIVDYDDWMLNPVVFADVEKLWGPHSVDRFASCHNCQIPRFNSRCWNPGSEAFTVNWEGEINWWCPPIGLIPRVLRHAEPQDRLLFRGGSQLHFGHYYAHMVQNSLPHLLEMPESCL